MREREASDGGTWRGRKETGEAEVRVRKGEKEGGRGRWGEGGSMGDETGGELGGTSGRVCPERAVWTACSGSTSVTTTHTRSLTIHNSSCLTYMLLCNEGGCTRQRKAV